MERVESVLLAAGESRRMPSWKPAIRLAGRPMIHWTVQAFLAVSHRVIVVGGYRFADLERLLAPFPVELVENPGYPQGMFSSVKVGLQVVQSGARWVFIHPADYPLVQPTTLRVLLQSRGTLVVPTHRGRKGHPLLVRGPLIPEILDWPDTETLRTFVRSHPLTLVETGDPGVVLDLDEPEDLTALETLARRRLAP